jgi:hypothetical protein
MKVGMMALLAAVLAASTASAYTVVLQASDYIASSNAGGADFYVTPCGGATNGLGVEGYDYAGDWIELKLVIGQEGTYRDSLRTAADDEAEGNHMVTIFGPGGEPVGSPSSLQSVGLGIG